MTIEGIDNTGSKKIIKINLAEILSNTYGIYDTMYYTRNLEDGTGSVTVFVNEADEGLVLKDASINVFGEDVVVGNLIAYRLASGTEVEGVIQVVRDESITLIAITSNGVPTPKVLTLVEATDPSFIGSILLPDYI
jgi:hypothetical protein